MQSSRAQVDIHVYPRRMAETLATGKVPDILAPFALDRFARFHQVGEKGAASVGH